MAAESSARLSFGRKMRLKQPREFSLVRLEGRRLALGCLIANWRPLPTGAPTRLGVITGKRIGNAVARNRARRLLRESFRLHQHELRQPMELVLVARASIAGKDFAGVELDYLAALRKAGLMKEIK